MTKQRKKSHLLNLIVWTLVSVAIAFLSIYSFSPFSRDELNIVNTRLSNVQANSGYRKNWVTFSSEEGQMFYCQTNMLEIKRASKLVKILDEYKDKELTVLYTNRKDMLPLNIYYFWNYDRVVAIEFEGSPIVSLEEYNSVNFGTFVGCVIASVIALLFGTLPYLIPKIVLTAQRNRKH